jgi:hypothetical protein
MTARVASLGFKGQSFLCCSVPNIGFAATFIALASQFAFFSRD